MCYFFTFHSPDASIQSEMKLFILAQAYWIYFKVVVFVLFLFFLLHLIAA